MHTRTQPHTHATSPKYTLSYTRLHTYQASKGCDPDQIRPATAAPLSRATSRMQIPLRCCSCLAAPFCWAAHHRIITMYSIVEGVTNRIPQKQTKRNVGDTKTQRLRGDSITCCNLPVLLLRCSVLLLALLQDTGVPSCCGTAKAAHDTTIVANTKTLSTIIDLQTRTLLCFTARFSS